ncbi:flagellar M-ring protein FliF [Marinitoga hydrogenitolerans DSM 16785]|uniref:Flagellar M-ring protein n=1 Tax=Marinitoga hydrogenitolerans (strain DSM 16785 / JCM 12826 / AT1271) TaxID=1122195 RepID=A0A1M4VN47_MARH1|nr:flagellar basal-body MS-ring/collar protein FliF [Marinitoga hydrogenitolerans]SHE70358.1 flagellar M-ring protein FliF [Marinitoga hydrogenitolerans DSM 16785]
MNPFQMIKDYWENFSTNQKIIYSILSATFVFLLIFLIALNLRPNYQVLISGVDEQQGGKIIAKLEELNIPYKVGPGGSIMVPEKYNKYELWMKLALNGVLGNQIQGYELLQKQNFGATSYDKQVNYQIALEGELSRSISTMKGIQYARVHIVMPSRTYYTPADKSKPTASVLLFLEPGANIDSGQVKAIMDFVAGAVQNLDPKDVKVVDNNSRNLSAQVISEGNIADAATKFDLKRKIEEYYTQKIENKLQQVFGVGAIVVIPEVELNWQKIEEESRKVQPVNKTAGLIVSEQKESEEKYSTSGTSNIPGVDSNVPPYTTQTPDNQGSDTYKTLKTITNYDFNEIYQKVTDDKNGEIAEKSITVFIDLDKSPIPENDTTKAQIKSAISTATGATPSNINILFTKFNKELEAEYQKIVQQTERARTITVITIISVIFIIVLVLLIIGIINLNKKRKARKTILERKKKLEEAATRAIEEIEPEITEVTEDQKVFEKLTKIVDQSVDDVVEILKYWINQ